jgi:hypothetical protein
MRTTPETTRRESAPFVIDIGNSMLVMGNAIASCGAWADGGAQLLPGGGHEAGGGGESGDAIQQLWRSRRGDGSLA